ncbi:MAG: PorP/SprF family type IX secretion system membrane protein [Flavobacteriales bacterium]
MKKNIFLMLTLSMIGLSTFAQQLPQFTYFTYNYLQYNPAVTGNTPCLELKIGARRQWTGLEGAPNTGFASVHTKFGQKKYNFHGVGAVVENDKFGPFSYTGLNFNYAYHMRMSKGYMLSSGIGIGFKQYRVNYSQILLEQQDIDPVIQNNANSFIFPVINFGLWLYKNDRFYGISMRQVNKATVAGIDKGELQSHWTFAYGKSIKMADDLFFKPAFLLNYVAQSKASLEAQAILSYKERFAIGMAGRSGSGLSALVKIDFLQFLTVAYAYDMTLNKMRFDGGPTHEFILGIRACGGDDGGHTRCAAYD